MPHATTSELIIGLHKLVYDVDPSMPMIIKGAPCPPLESLDQWISFEILFIANSPARRFTIDKAVDIQLTVYCKYANLRNDNRFDAIYELADKYARLFDRKDIVIKSTCISFKENKIIPLDLRSIGDFAKDIIQQLPPLHTLSAVILNQGIINSYQEVQ